MSVPTSLPKFAGSSSRTVIILTIIVAATALAWNGTFTGVMAYGLFTLILGGAVHASGAKQGADAATPNAENS